MVRTLAVCVALGALACGERAAPIAADRPAPSSPPQAPPGTTNAAGAPPPSAIAPGDATTAKASDGTPAGGAPTDGTMTGGESAAADGLGSSANPPGPTNTAAGCPADMADIGRFCIDRYEAPNVAGAKPLLMQSALDGEAWCKERGKRLCREREWVRACGGPSYWNYPYGITYRRATCNDDKTYRVPRWASLRAWPSDAARAEVTRLDQSEPSGSRAGCVSPEGVYDLTGNVAEWVVRTEDNPTNHDHVVKGCYWNQCYRPPHAPACDYVNYAHQGAERSYEMGFRCCRDRDAS